MLFMIVNQAHVWRGGHYHIALREIYFSGIPAYHFHSGIRLDFRIFFDSLNSVFAISLQKG